MAGATPGDPTHESPLSPEDHYGPAWEPLSDEELPAYASFSRRAVALIIDGLITGIMALSIGAALGVPGFENSAAGGTVTATTQAIDAGWSSILFAAVSALYFVGSWLSWGASPGQKLLTTRVCQDGGPVALTLSAAVIRWAILFGVSSAIGAAAVAVPSAVSILGLGQLAWVIVLGVTTYRNPQSQGLHDQYAHSVVIRG